MISFFSSSTPPSNEKESTPKPDNTSTSDAQATGHITTAAEQQNNTSTGSSIDAANAEVTTTADNLWVVASERSPLLDDGHVRRKIKEDKSILEENGQLLQTLTNYIVTGNKYVYISLIDNSMFLTLAS